MEQGKVILILCDGMRPDALEQVAPPLYRHIRREGAWAMDARSVMPPVTLPAHVSLMQSVDPQRHGILTNTYTPQSRPIEGLFDQLHREGKTCAFFYNWDELRDLSRPGSLNWYGFSSGVEGGFEKTDEESLAAARACLAAHNPDFLFLYLGAPDEAGHEIGWMTEPYLRSVAACWDRITALCSDLSEADHVLVTADHGGHGRDHGLDIPEDMTIPLLLSGPRFAGRGQLTGVSIKDIAPTVTALLGVRPSPRWEGRSLL